MDLYLIKEIRQPLHGGREQRGPFRGASLNPRLMDMDHGKQLLSLVIGVDSSLMDE